MLITRRPHRRYIFNYLNNSEYIQYTKGYSLGKQNYSRGIYLWATGLGIWSLVQEAVKGELKRYGKKKIAIVCLSAGAWAFGPVVTLVTNSSKIIGAAIRIHSFVSFGAECLEDGENLVFLPLDFALFGQPIPVGDPDRFNVMMNFTDFRSSE